jgi:uncharacterized protein
MQNPTLHTIGNQSFWLSPERSIFWEEENTVIIADLHLGKTGHFRREGIAIPQSVYKADLQRLMATVYFYKADRLIIAGDFTHSATNQEMDHFLRWRNDFSMLHIDLVLGNHDILEKKWYKEASIQVHAKELLINGFCFRHQSNEKTSDEKISGKNNTAYSFTGHVHPGVLLKGPAKQTLKFPCFYFTKENCILPAFSRFTGTYKVVRKENETVYAIVEKELVKIPA